MAYKPKNSVKHRSFNKRHLTSLHKQKISRSLKRHMAKPAKPAKPKKPKKIKSIKRPIGKVFV